MIDDQTLFGPDPLSDSDAICQWLYEATSASGSANPILARELADGVSHFLRVELDASANARIVRETAAKIIRELGHPRLAEFVISSASRGLQSRETYPEHLVAAHSAGLLTINGIDSPDQVIGEICDATEIQQKFGSVYRFLTVREPLLDSLWGLTPPARQVAVVWNFNAGRAAQSGEGANLFADPSVVEADNEPLCLLRQIMAFWNRVTNPRSIWTWHLAADNFASNQQTTLHAVIRISMSTRNLVFALDRNSRSPSWATGLRENIPCVLESVTLNLDRLMQWLPSGARTPDVFVDKTASLARLALEAAHVKQDMTQRHGSLVVSVQGIDAVANSREFARAITDRLMDVFEADPRGIPVAFGPAEWDDHGNGVIDLTSGMSAADQVAEIPVMTRQVNLRFDPKHPLNADRIATCLRLLLLDSAVERAVPSPIS